MPTYRSRVSIVRISDLMAKILARQRVEVAQLSTMAALALLLSAVAIFALVANIVAQKTREIGIRIALGSSIRQAMVHIGSAGSASVGTRKHLGVDLLCGSFAGYAQRPL